MNGFAGFVIVFVVLGVIFKVNAPRCRTCGKRKMQMHLTDKLDCMRCHIKHELSKQ